LWVPSLLAVFWRLSRAAVALPSSRSVRKSKGAARAAVAVIVARRRDLKETIVNWIGASVV
jgi:hypothetical protein